MSTPPSPAPLSHRPTSVRSSRHAFTLIELLVVVAIIGVIASLSFAAYAQSQAKGKEAACVSNLRQIASCLNMYASENNQFYPAGSMDNPDGGAGKIMWSKALGPYLPQKGRNTTSPENQIFVCPAAHYIKSGRETYQQVEISRTYSATAAIMGSATLGGTLGATTQFPRQVMTIASPVDTIIVVEGKQESVGNASCPSTLGWSSHIMSDVAVSKPEDTKFFDFRHSKKMNVIYGDYSVRTVELADLKAPAFTKNRWLGTE